MVVDREYSTYRGTVHNNVELGGGLINQNDFFARREELDLHL